jgi:hypothetical protein
MLVNILDMEWCLILPSIALGVAIFLKGKVQFLVLNRERKRERKFLTCRFMALEERFIIKTVL